MLAPLSLHLLGGCDYRLGVFKLLIDDYINFFNYEDFDVIYVNINFRRIYSQSQILTSYCNKMIEKLLLYISRATCEETIARLLRIHRMDKYTKCRFMHRLC